MKRLEEINFEYELCRQQVGEFRALLESRTELAEASDVLPFFRDRRHLAVLLGMFNTRIAWADRIAYEFDVFGDFACDLVVGEWGTGSYCFVEFEDASLNSVFDRQGKKATRDWSRRFDHGCSQIVDWLHKLNDLSGGHDFVTRFGRPLINYETVLVIGRDQHLDEGERQRLEWRSNNVVVNSKRIHCLTFDQLLSQLSTRLSVLSLVAQTLQIGGGTTQSGVATEPAGAPPPETSPPTPPLPPTQSG